MNETVNANNLTANKTNLAQAYIHLLSTCVVSSAPLPFEVNDEQWAFFPMVSDDVGIFSASVGQRGHFFRGHFFREHFILEPLGTARLKYSNSSK